jgi:hypothetical protein
VVAATSRDLSSLLDPVLGHGDAVRTKPSEVEVVGGCEFVVAIRSCVVVSGSLSSGTDSKSARKAFAAASDFDVPALHSSPRVGVFAGAGIVAGSNPLLEWQETETKMKPLLSRLAPLQIVLPSHPPPPPIPEKEKVEVDVSSLSGTTTAPNIPSISPVVAEGASSSSAAAVNIPETHVVVTPVIGGWKPEQSPNLNALWASALVEELERLGVDFVVSTAFLSCFTYRGHWKNVRTIIPDVNFHAFFSLFRSHCHDLFPPPSDWSFLDLVIYRWFVLAPAPRPSPLHLLTIPWAHHSHQHHYHHHHRRRRHPPPWLE